MRSSRRALVAALALLAIAAPAGADPGDITTFADPETEIDAPWVVAPGPDANLWFTNFGNDRIGRIDPDTGDITTFADPELEVDHPIGITAGPDGNIWFTSTGNQRIGRIDPDAPNPAATIETFVDLEGELSGPAPITPGPDGNLWFTNGGNDRIGRIDPDAPDPAASITTFTDPGGQVDHPTAIAAGPDGNLWFSSQDNDRIGRIDPASGTIATFGSTSIDFPGGITGGPDGNVWFTNEDGDSIGRLDPGAADPEASITVFDDPSGTTEFPAGLTAGPDGNLWFTNEVSDNLGRITTFGVIATFADAAVDMPVGVVPADDGNVWFAGAGNDRLGFVEPFVFPDHAFADVPSEAWYGTGLEWASDTEIVTGFPDNTYRPKDPVNRGQIVNMLWVLMGSPQAPTPHPFTDVPDGVWYQDALDWAADTEIVTGFPDNTYRPKDPVNRGQIVNMLWTAVGRPPPLAPHPFSDVPDGVWYETALDWAAAERLVSGFPDGTYRPKDPVNRGQVANALFQLASGPHAWEAFGPPPAAVTF